MSNVKLSTPRSKQLNLALHSRLFRSYPSTSSRTWKACLPLRERPFRFSCQGCPGGCRRRGALGPEPARQRALHGLPQAQARGMVPLGPKTRPQATRGRRGQARARRRQPRPTLRLVEATAVGSYSISKAYRPEFDVRGASERAPDRDRAVPGLHSAVFGSRPQ